MKDRIRPPVFFLFFMMLPAAAGAAIEVTGFFRPDSVADWQGPTFDRRFTVIGGSGQDGALTMDGGSTLIVTGQGTFFGTGTNPANAIVILTDEGTQLTINSTDEFVLGNNGSNGTMSILNGADFVTNQDAFIGRDANADGDMTIDGQGSLWQAQNIDVGREATGSLTVRNEGQITATGLAIGRDGGSGTLTVEGDGSSSFSTITSSSGFSVSQGSALNVSNGGRIEVANEVTLSGLSVLEDSGSSITAGGDFGISSDNGQAHLIVQNGAQVDVGTSGGGNTTVGFFNGAGGQLTVKGSGSVWNSNSDFVLGDRGDGVVDILDGGRINTNNVFRLFGQGKLNVRGTGSLLQSNGSVVIYDGGVLTIIDGGQVNARDFLEVQTGGTANIFVNRSGMVQSGGGGFSGEYNNRGTTNLFASAGLASGDYTPIQVNGSGAEIQNVGTFNAIGGSFDVNTGVFSVSDITTDDSGALGGKRVAYNNNRLVVSFADSVGDIDFEVTQIFPTDIDDRFLVAAYSFDTTLEDTPTGLSIVLAETATLDDLYFWYRADEDSPWEAFDESLTAVDGNYATLLVSQFSDYALTSDFFIPEPSLYSLIVGCIALSATALRRRRLS
ncbi:MAG: hypothetical protein AAF546_12075 [Verrucomicrobiota bacterium]